jgi:hypothetical protein
MGSALTQNQMDMDDPFSPALRQTRGESNPGLPDVSPPKKQQSKKDLEIFF